MDKRKPLKTLKFQGFFGTPSGVRTLDTLKYGYEKRQCIARPKLWRFALKFQYMKRFYGIPLYYTLLHHITR